MPVNNPANPANPFASSGRAPLQGPDSTPNINPRVTRYGEQWVQALTFTKDGLAQEGRYYVVTNPAIGTTVGFGVSASFADTAPLFVVNNTEASGGRTISLDYLRLFVTVAPASGTSARLVVATDSALRIPTAGNSGILTPQNVNAAYPNDAQTNIQAGTGGANLTVPASVNRRIVSNMILRNAIPVAFDEIIAVFGQEVLMSGAPTTATQAGSVGGPVVVPPGTSACFHIWFPSNAVTGLSAEYELGFWMR